MNESVMKLRVLPWEFDPDVCGYASAIARQGCGQGRFVDMVVTEGIDEVHWEIVPEFVAPQCGCAETLEEGKQSALRAGLKLLIHGVSSESDEEDPE